MNTRTCYVRVTEFTAGFARRCALSRILLTCGIFYIFCWKSNCLRRFAVILFLLTHLFNLCGYQLVFSTVERNSVVSIEEKVDRNSYRDDELISVKTPLHLPYYNSSTQFERVYGSITIEGKEYEYVKRRVYRDTLELLCLPNLVKAKIIEVSNEVAKSSGAESEAAPVKKGGNVLKPSLPQFFQSLSTDPSQCIATEMATLFYSFNTQPPTGDYSSCPETPPRTTSFTV